MGEPPFAPRAVKPRSRRYKRLPVVALDKTVGSWLDENGETRVISDIRWHLPRLAPTLFAMVGSADFLAELNKLYTLSHPDTWQFRVSNRERDIIRQHDGVKVAARVTMAVHFFGFKGGNYHKLIDPVTMYGHSLDDVWPESDEPRIRRLLAWAVQVRNFCDENQMEVRPTIGGISAQFLTDNRFYPERRRKVPRATNDRARDNLPGNHYALAATTKHEYQAWYLDQHAAHHYHARTVKLPDANSLYAYGDFHDLNELVWEQVPKDFLGLLCVDLCSYGKPRQFDWISRTLNDRQYLGRNFVFTNELQHLYDSGYAVNGVRAAWGSFTRDAGLPRYATWATGELDRFGEAKWLKPILLATYGTLATKASFGETVWRLAKRGEPVEVLTGHHTLPGILTKRPKQLEMGVVNVIHRGMIEAGCRSESVGFAQHLTYLGYRVLAIYADAVMVQQDDDLEPPQLPEPWRLKTELTHLQFINKQAFASGEMTKLPGVGREALEYRQRSPGHAPKRMMTEALSGYQRRSKTRRI